MGRRGESRLGFMTRGDGEALVEDGLGLAAFDDGAVELGAPVGVEVEDELGFGPAFGHDDASGRKKFLPHRAWRVIGNRRRKVDQAFFEGRVASR